MRKKQIIMAVIIGLGVILRLLKLGSQSVWQEEFLTTFLSSGHNLFFVFFNAIENGTHPPLFYMLEHIVINIFGASEFSIRLLPALIGILNIFIFHKLARSFFNEKASTIAVFLFALNPFQIYYSQEAGPYPLYLMISMLIIYYFLMSIKYNLFTAGPFIAWSIIGLYAHENTVILLLILNFIIFVTNRKDIRLVPWSIAQGIILAAWLPLLLLSVKPAAVFAARGSALAPLYSLKTFLFGPALPLNWAIIACIIICLVFVVLGVISKRKANEKRMLDALTLMIIFIMIIQWIISFIQPGNYADKNMLNAAALILLVLAVGVSYMSDQGLAAFGVLITAVYGVSLFNYFFRLEYQKTGYESVYKKIRAHVIDRGLIIHTSDNSWSAFEFYDKYKYKLNIENRLRDEPEAFSGKGMQLSIYDMRKNFRDNLKKAFKFDLSGFNDKKILGQEELKSVIGAHKTAVLVEDNLIGLKQPYLPQASVWNAQVPLEAPAGPEKIWWIKEYFNIKDKISIYGCDAYLLEKK
jgi:hypothetical protein